jgi:hypothetical protein
MAKTKTDTKNDEIFQCDGFAAIRHRCDAKSKYNDTECNLRPTQKQWEAGSIAWEHGDMAMEYACQICFPES